MRRIHALLIAVGLAAAPSSAVAGTPSSSSSSAQDESASHRGRLGVMVSSLTPELRTHFGAPPDRGVLVAYVAAMTPAAAAGVSVGDVIVEIGGKPIRSSSDVMFALSDVGRGQAVPVQLVRAGKPHSLRATMTSESLADLFERIWPGGWWRNLMKQASLKS